VANGAQRARIIAVAEAVMIRGQAFWFFLLFLGMLLSTVVIAFERAHAPLVSGLSWGLVDEILFSLAIGLTCLRVQRRLGALQGRVEQKSLAYISQGIYLLAAFSYMALMSVTTHLRVR
jgi:hypothetical protein